MLCTPLRFTPGHIVVSYFGCMRVNAVVPINNTARRSLIRRLNFRAERCPASPWVFCNENGERIKDVKRSFATACRRAGITDFRVHDLRHTCAAWLVTAGVPLSEVKDLLGPSSVVVTERYAHLAPENVRTAVQVLDRSHFGHTEDEEKWIEPFKSLI